MVKPRYYTLSAMAIGYLLLDDTNMKEQNALGNWLMLVAQILCTNASFVQYNDGKTSDKDTLNMLKKMVDVLEKEIGKFKE